MTISRRGAPISGTSSAASRFAPELSGTAYGVDGIALIDQNRALAGNVTPFDAPGFPVTISQSGSYRLSGNLTGSDVKTNAIEITANDVVIDLNSFVIRGPVTCSGVPVNLSSCAPVGLGSGIRRDFN